MRALHGSAQALYRSGQVISRTARLAATLPGRCRSEGGLHNALRKVVTNKITLDQAFYDKYNLVIKSGYLDSNPDLSRRAFGFKSSTWFYHASESALACIAFKPVTMMYFGGAYSTFWGLEKVGLLPTTTYNESEHIFEIITMICAALAGVVITYPPFVALGCCTGMNYYYFGSKTYQNRSRSADNLDNLDATQLRSPDQYLDSYILALSASFAAAVIRIPMSCYNSPNKAASVSFLLIDLALADIYNEGKILNLRN